MNTYKIEVSYSRVLEIEAEDSYKAREAAKVDAAKSLREADAIRWLDAKEYEPKTNWLKEAEEDGGCLADDIADKIEENVRNYRDSKEGDKDEKAEAIEYDESDVQEIFDGIYQEEDTYYRASEYADGRFIYNSIDALTDAMQCIDELDNYASGDSSLWEGQNDYASIINIQAADAFCGAVHSYAKDAIKARISELLGV